MNLKLEIEYMRDDLGYIARACGNGMAHRVERLLKLIDSHHDVSATGHVSDWGKICLVCKKFDESKEWACEKT